MGMHFPDIPPWIWKWGAPGVITGLLALFLTWWIYRKTRKKPHRPRLSPPCFDKARTLALNANGEVDIFHLLHWRTRYENDLPGRKDDLDVLLSWAREDDGLKAGLITAPGGAGKTRLAAEAAARLAAEGWTAGIVSPSDLDREDLKDFFPARRWKTKGLFLVVDYPEEARQDGLEDLLGKLRRWQEKTGHAARLLMLGRDQDRERWQNLFREQRWSGALNLQLAAVSALAEPETVQLARSVHAELAMTSPFHALPDGYETRLLEWLRRDPTRHGLPLIIIATMLDAMLRETTDFSLSATEVLGELAEREATRAKRISRANGWNENCLPRLLALATLAGGLSVQALRRLRDLTDGPCGGRVDVEVLARSPWWNAAAEHLAPLQPDRPAAAFIVRALLDDAVARADLPRWLDVVLQGREAQFSARLPRLVWDIAQADPGHEAHQRLLKALSDIVRDDETRARAFAAIAQQKPHGAAAFAAVVAQKLVDTSENDAKKAGWLNNLAAILSDLGRREEALEAAKEAAELYRQLDRDNPQAFRPYLARSCGVLGHVLMGMERHDEAQAALVEGLEAISEPLRALPQVFAPLARALLSDYIQACEAGNLAPKKEVVEPLMPILTRHAEQAGKET